MKIKLLLLAVLFSPLISFAQKITLYDQPATNAKIVGNADLSSGIIPIFTPSTGDWTKIADPTNGNVGWVKKSDISHAKGTTNFSQQIITNNPASQSNQTFLFGMPQNMNQEQMQAWVKKAQEEQQMMQQKFQNVMKDMNELFQREWQLFNSNSLLPVQPTTQPTTQPVKNLPVQNIKSNQTKP